MNYIDPTKMIGASLTRIDGPKKVSGKAIYTSDHNFPGLLYAVPVSSSVASGTIDKLDLSVAEKMPGVRAILHADNIAKLYRPTDSSPSRR